MVNISDISIDLLANALTAMQIIDSGGAQIALVVDSQKCLVGTLTDGDIRRALLNGESIESPVERIMNRCFRYVRRGDDISAVLQMMRSEALLQIPVLDDKGRVVELLLLQDLIAPARIPNPVVIMAGGRGTRLRPYTENCPKPMIHVDGKPMLEIILEACISSGFHKFYFSVNYLKEQIIDHFGYGDAWGVSIDYLIEDQPMGTAGSLQFLPSTLKDPFLVMNGDVLTRFDLIRLLRFHSEHDAVGTLCVREHTTTVPFGVVQTKGAELSGFIEKPSYRQLVNAGVYVIDPKLLSLLPPRQVTDMPLLLQNAQLAGHRVVVCPIHEYWIDVGRPEALRQAHHDWSTGDAP